jgi:hypothetical protein
MMSILSLEGLYYRAAGLLLPAAGLAIAAF